MTKPEVNVETDDEIMAVSDGGKEYCWTQEEESLSKCNAKSARHYCNYPGKAVIFKTVQ